MRLGRSATHGRGVFAARAIAAEEVVEVCPVIVVPADERDHLDRTTLGNHYFEWDDEGNGGLPFGLGSFYNHAADPAAQIVLDIEGEALEVIALRDIAEGEEVTIHYGGGEDVDLWFEPA